MRTVKAKPLHITKPRRGSKAHREHEFHEFKEHLMAVVQALTDVVASLQTEVAALAARIPVGGATPAEQAALAATIQTQVDAIKALAPST